MKDSAEEDTIRGVSPDATQIVMPKVADTQEPSTVFLKGSNDLSKLTAAKKYFLVSKSTVVPVKKKLPLSCY